MKFYLRRQLSRKPFNRHESTSPFVEVTLCSKDRHRIFANQAFVDTLTLVCEKSRDYAVNFYVVMPDHVHLIVSAKVSRPMPPSHWSTWFKQEMSKSWKSRPELPIWQSGCFDRQIRRDESLDDRYQYFLQNPVRAGLVETPEDWPYKGEQLDL